MCKLSLAFLKNRSAFIPFIMAGYPKKEDTIDLMLALEKSGADIIELGVPFSDPVADGPINQEASQVAIENGMALKLALNQVNRAKALGLKVPIVLFTYLNPILAMGEDDFIGEAIKNGVDGLLIVDLPLEEGEDFYIKSIARGLEIILLASPTTKKERLILCKKIKPSFIYYISRLSVTGMQKDLSQELEKEVLVVKKMLPEYKIAVGFGISSLEQAQKVASMADGVVVGSKLVSTVKHEGFLSFAKLAGELAKVIHG